jgi:hypothetical protein
MTISAGTRDTRKRGNPEGTKGKLEMGGKKAKVQVKVPLTQRKERQTKRTSRKSKH